MQETLTYIIVGGALGYALYKVSKLLVIRKKTDPYCEDVKCGGCSFKDGCHHNEEVEKI